MKTEKERSRCCPIIVLGVERSGTSVVTEMVHKWGAYAGEAEKLTQADVHNPQGYWEYKTIWDFLVDLGDFAAGASWWDASFQERVKAKRFIPQYRDKALALVALMEKGEKGGQPWTWKDPALSFFLPFWKEIWGQAVYIITVRQPYDTACSWQQFVMPAELEGSVSLIAGNLLRWQYMMLLILQHTAETERKLFISYEALMQEPWSQAHRLYTFLNQTYAVRVLDDPKIKVMAEAVVPKLWHNRSQIPFAQVHEATHAQKALYHFLERKVKAPFKPFEPAKYPLPPGWREFVQNGEALIRAHSTTD